MNTEKLQEMILYIAMQSSDDPHFGATKLNKILFFADFWAYAYWGKSITDATYVHWDHGPIPKEMLAARQALITAKRAVVEDREHYGFSQKRLVALGNANLTLFTSDEIQLVDDVISQVERHNGTELSDGTHQLLPWLDTVQGEEIPYFTVFGLKARPATKEIKRQALQRLEELRASGLAV